MKRLVYLSTPITGKDINEVKKRVENEKERFKSLNQFGDAIYISPFDVCSVPDDVLPYEYYLSRCIEIMMKCDVVVFDKQWHKSKGCRVEKHICETYDIHHVILDYEIPI